MEVKLILGFLASIGSFTVALTILFLCLSRKKKRDGEEESSIDEKGDNFDRIDSMSFSGRYPSCYLTSEFDEISSLRISVIDI